MTQRYQSRAGYIGAYAVIIFSYALVFLRSMHIITEISHGHIFLLVGLTFIAMVVGEYFLKSHYNKKNHRQVVYHALNGSALHLLKSSLWRFIALLLPLLLFYYIIHHHNYFAHGNFFAPTRELADYYLYLFLILSPPYIVLTLIYRGNTKYEFGDYAILSMVAVKSLVKSFVSKKYNKRFYLNRRVKKVWLLYLVNFLFLTLMGTFMIQEFKGFESNFFFIGSEAYHSSSWYEQFRRWYLLLFHLIFTIDVSIAIIGYSFASRWLDNRTRSVDTTLGGWIVAFLCYPPLNAAFTSQFIPYQGLDTHHIITQDYYLALILILQLLLYSIYVWSTTALGFKFSNLTNRGIVSIGPYRYVRHPAYAAKNLSWWIDNTYVLSNIWAIGAMAMWNLIYITRAITEERHLKQDKAYIKYSKHVKNMFIPKLI